ncbi:MAG: hypothetical protein ABR541_03340 [Candidatus Dormibacteria bacterium]
MIRSIRLATAGFLVSGCAVATTPLIASAQGPVVTGGLVNVTIANNNVLNNNTVTVTVPIQAAANICGVTVAVLSTGITAPGGFSCTSNPSQGTTVTVTP